MAPKRTSTGRVTKTARKNTKAPSFLGLEKATASIYTQHTPTAPDLASDIVSINTMTNTAANSSGEQDGKKDGPVYFWKPNQGHGYLGQWYWSEFTVESDNYKTAEMWMMVQKARLFGDEAVARKMLDTIDPKQHKALGREVRNFDQQTWNLHRMRIVTEGNIHKFSISEDADNLRGMLLATGERELVEASPMDRIWGVGFAEKNAGKNRHRWGQNLLGKALMDVRKRLREEEKKDKEE